MTILITKPQRLMLARDIADIMRDVFGKAPVMRHLEDDEAGSDFGHGASDIPANPFLVPCAVGEMAVTVRVCPQMISLYCRICPDRTEPMSADEIAITRLVKGNDLNGKANLHVMPDRKLDTLAASGLLSQVRHHFMILRHGTLDYSKPRAA